MTNTSLGLPKAEHTCISLFGASAKVGGTIQQYIKLGKTFSNTSLRLHIRRDIRIRNFSSEGNQRAKPTDN